MAEDGLDEVADGLRRADPELFLPSLFAPEPLRGRLQALYAFDVELSRAAEASGETLISRMRIQFWQDVVDAIRASEAPRAHPVAEAMAARLPAAALAEEDFDRLAEARVMELNAPFSEATFEAWLDARFSALARLGAQIAAQDRGPDLMAAAAAAGRARGLAFVLRTARAMAAGGGRALMPGLSGADRSALARGEVTPSAAAAAVRLAEAGQAALAQARRHRVGQPRPARPVFLSVWQADRVFARLVASRGSALSGPLGAGPGRRSLALAWRGMTGRW